LVKQLRLQNMRYSHGDSAREWIICKLNYRESYKIISLLPVLSTEPDERHSLMQASAREKSVGHLY
jgi:hypothetical protein